MAAPHQFHMQIQLVAYARCERDMRSGKRKKSPNLTKKGLGKSKYDLPLSAWIVCNAELRHLEDVVHLTIRSGLTVIQLQDGSEKYTYPSTKRRVIASRMQPIKRAKKEDDIGKCASLYVSEKCLQAVSSMLYLIRRPSWCLIILQVQPCCCLCQKYEWSRQDLNLQSPDS